MRALRWLVKDSKPSDSLVFVFSGRSAQASPGEELQTGSSEGLLPIDYAQVLPVPTFSFPTCLCHPLESKQAHCLCQHLLLDLIEAPPSAGWRAE